LKRCQCFADPRHPRLNTPERKRTTRRGERSRIDARSGSKPTYQNISETNP
jgi:hypothetical protein